jgi:hypothetical protein
MKYKTTSRMFENIYDLIKGGQFEEQSKKELRKWIKNKHIEWNGYNEGKDWGNTINIGKHFTIKLITK